VDKAKADTLLALLSYAHPALVVVGLLLALWALRLGLHLRDFRVRRIVPPRGSLGRHLRLSQPAAILLTAGFAIGPVSTLVLRGWTPFTTLHAWAGIAALACFGSTSLLGLGLKKKRNRRSQLHGVLGMVGMLAGALAAVTGIELLP
jgi:hypothetical protein